MRRNVVTAAAALVAAAASGCHERTGTGEIGHTGVKWLDERHDPVQVRLTIDTANRVTRTVGDAGATMTATGEDGTFFTLEIPEGALHQRVAITLLPVKRVDGLPLEQGGGLGMVQLQPDGLRFDRPARLTIEVEKPVPANERLAFAWSADGHDAHLYPATGGDSLELRLQLLHFSGYGFAQAPPSDPGRIHLLQASAHRARLEAQLAAAIRADLDAQPAGGEGSGNSAALWESFLKVTLEYYTGIVAPTMKIAERDDRMAECAMKFFFDWERQAELFGLVDHPDAHGHRVPTTPAVDHTDPRIAAAIAEGTGSAGRIMSNLAAGMMKRADEDCRRHDLRAYLQVFEIDRQFQLMPFADASELPNIFEVQERMEADCNRWEVELVSDVESRLPSGASRFQLASTARFNGKDKGDESALNYKALEVSGRPFKDVFDAMTGGHGGALLGKGSPFVIADVSMSKRGSRHGSVRILSVDWTYRPDTTKGTSCAGADEDQIGQTTDSLVHVTLLINPPTEIVRFTSVIPGVPPHDADMHEWMRYFTQFRQNAGDESVPANGSADNDRPETQEAAQVVTIELKATGPGVWRAEFNTNEGVLQGGPGLSETGHLVLRHTPG